MHKSFYCNLSVSYRGHKSLLGKSTGVTSQQKNYKIQMGKLQRNKKIFQGTNSENTVI